MGISYKISGAVVHHNQMQISLKITVIYSKLKKKKKINIVTTLNLANVFKYSR